MSKYSYNYINSLSEDEKSFVQRYFNLFSSKKSLAFNEIFDNYSEASSYEEASLKSGSFNSALLSTIQDNLGRGLAYFYLNSDYNKHLALLRRAIVLFEKGFKDQALLHIEEGLKHCEQTGKSITVLSFLYLKHEITGSHTNELKTAIDQSRTKLAIVFLQRELDNLNTEVAASMLKRLQKIEPGLIKSDFGIRMDVLKLKTICLECIGEIDEAIQLLDAVELDHLFHESGSTDRILAYYVNCFQIYLTRFKEEFFVKKIKEFENYCSKLPKHSFANSKFHRVQIEAKYEFNIIYLLLKNEVDLAYIEIQKLLTSDNDMKMIVANSALHKVLLVASYCAFRKQEYKVSLKLINQYKQYVSSKVKEADLLEIFIHNKLGNLNFSDRLIASYFYTHKTPKKSDVRILLNQLKKLKGKKEFNVNQLKIEADLKYIDPIEFIKIVNQYG